MKRGVPIAGSSSVPRMNNANMLSAMWMTPAWRKPAVTIRHQSPSATVGALSPAWSITLAPALRAPHADGGDRHAVGADRAPAVRAGHVRRATGMAIALGHGAREATGRSSEAEGVRAGVGPQVRPRAAG